MQIKHCTLLSKSPVHRKNSINVGIISTVEMPLLCTVQYSIMVETGTFEVSKGWVQTRCHPFLGVGCRQASLSVQEQGRQEKGGNWCLQNSPCNTVENPHLQWLCHSAFKVYFSTDLLSHEQGLIHREVRPHLSPKCLHLVKTLVLRCKQLVALAFQDTLYITIVANAKYPRMIGSKEAKLKEVQGWDEGWKLLLRIWKNSE